MSKRELCPKLSRCLVPVLGFWHVVKVAAEAVWNFFLPTILAPAFHALYPDRNLKSSPKLWTIFELFNKLAFAYSTCSQGLQDLVEELDLPLKRCVDHFYYFFDFALPVVRCFSF
ncbi:MAG: hypothetical protein GY938_12085 [Ketobacter sp.]|nr:hypothetical protein [Ketobacter sp.]